MATRRSWLLPPREGFTLDYVIGLIKRTAFNPALTLPLFLLARLTERGRQLALGHPLAADGLLRWCLYLGAARWANGLLNRGALNNWTRARFDWSKELVVVTGGSDGMGKILVEMLARRGIRVVVLDKQAPRFDLPNSGVHYFQLDLTDPEAVRSVCGRVKSELGDPSVVVLNAGIANRYSIVNLPDDALQRVVAVNQLSHYRLAREFVPAMARANHGAVVVVASLAGFVTPPGMVDYCGTKAAAVSFYEGLSLELVSRYNAPAVRTVLVCPNFVRTKLSQGFYNPSTFLNPTLHPETVVEAVFDKLMAGESGLVTVPENASWTAMPLRTIPHWLQRGLLGELSETMKHAESVQAKEDKDGEARQEVAIG